MASELFGDITPVLVVPDHFYCNQSSTIVAIYNEAIGDESQQITLQFPGNASGSPPQRITPQRVDSRTLVFQTPVYSTSRARGMVEVVPVLATPTGGDVKLATFGIAMRHPVTNVIELCMRLSSSDAVLPVLMALMLHCHDNKSKEYFQDSQIDRIMATLVGSRTPGTTAKIDRIILPEKRWRGLQLADFARKFELSEMERQAYIMKTTTLARKKKKKDRKRSIATADEADTGEEGGSEGSSRSTQLPLGGYVQLTKQPPQHLRHLTEHSTTSQKVPPKVPLKVRTSTEAVTPPGSPQVTKKWHSTELVSPLLRSPSAQETTALRLLPTPPLPQHHHTHSTSPGVVKRNEPHLIEPSTSNAITRELGKRCPLGGFKVADSTTMPNQRPQPCPRERFHSEDGQHFSDSASQESYESVVDSDWGRESEDATRPIGERIRNIEKTLGTAQHPVRNMNASTFPAATTGLVQAAVSSSRPPHPQSPQAKPRNLPKLKVPIATPPASDQSSANSSSESDGYVDVETFQEPLYVNAERSDVMISDDHIYDRPEITSAQHTPAPSKQASKTAPALPPPNWKKLPQHKKQRPDVPQSSARSEREREIGGGGGAAVVSPLYPRPSQATPQQISKGTRATAPRDILRASTPPPVAVKKPRARQVQHVPPAMEQEPDHRTLPATASPSPLQNRKVPLLPPPLGRGSRK